MKVKDITSVIEEFAPLSYQESYDNAGLIIGSPDKEVTAALFCVDVTEAVIDEALSLGANLVISHHPIIFHPVKKINDTEYVDRVIVKAIRSDVALYSCHTNLDSAESGLSRRMAEMMGLENIEVLAPRAENPASGFGAVGDLPQEQAPEAFLEKVKEVFGVGAIRHSVFHKPKIKRVAMVSGAGSSLFADAIRRGADMLVTSDIRYNSFLDAQGRIILADIGHFESEYCSIDILYGIVTKKMYKFAAYKSKLSVNPVIYMA